MKRGTLIGILGLLLLSATTAQPAVAVEVTIQPASTVVGIGQPLSLDRITDVVNLFFFEFDLSFDPAIRAASSITCGLFLPNFTPGTIDNTLGTLVGTGGSSFGSGVSGTGTTRDGLVHGAGARHQPGNAVFRPAGGPERHSDRRRHSGCHRQGRS
jgi:hypothetical protein